MSQKPRHPEKVNKPFNPIKKKPQWIRSKIVDSKIFFQTKKIVNEKDNWSIKASHNGYLKKFGIIHERSLEFYPENNKLIGKDKIVLKKGFVLSKWSYFHQANSVNFCNQNFVAVLLYRIIHRFALHISAQSSTQLSDTQFYTEFYTEA